MVALRSRRLETLLGAPINELTTTHIDSLVRNSIPEDFDLDFKVALYGRSDADKRALAGDVAALANTAGGVVIIGVAEGDQAQAVHAPGVDLTDAEKARMLQVVASGVSPMPTLEIFGVPKDLGHEPLGEDDAAALTGYYIIAVPRSPSAPHAVVVNEGFRYPKRNGATTRYLSEPEVAAAYRDRLAGLEGQVRRSDLIESEARKRLSRDETPWVMVSLVPDLPGDVVITYSLQRGFQQETVGKPAYDVMTGGLGVSFLRAGVGRHRLTADGGSDGVLAKEVYLEYHADGAGTYSLDLWDLWQTARAETLQTSPEAVVNQLVDDESIVFATLTGLRRLAVHARDRAAAGGNALVRLHLLPSLKHGLEVGHTRQWSRGESRSKLALTEHIGAAETVASLDELTTPGPALVAVAARLVNEMGQVFGIPEMGQLTPDGEVRIRYFGRHAQDRLKVWGEEHGVVVSDRTLDDE